MLLFTRTPTNYFLLPIIVLCVLWFLPYILNFIYRKKLFTNPVVRLSVSLLFLFSLGVFSVIFKRPNFGPFFLPLLALFSIKYFLFYKNNHKFFKFPDGEEKTVFYLLLISIIVLSFSELVKDYPLFTLPTFEEKFIETGQDLRENYLNYEGDYILPFNSVGRYLMGKKGLSDKILHIYNVTDRTPFFNLALTPLLKIFDGSFFAYQMISVVFSILYIAPAYLIARKYLTRLTATLCCLALSFSQFFLLISTFGQTKTITLFFVLTAIWLMINFSKKNIYLSALISSLFFAEAYFCHQFSLIYYLAGFLVFLILIFSNFKNKDWKIKKDFKKVFLIIALYLTPVLFTYFFWNKFANSVIGTPNLIYQNILFRNTWGEAGPSIKSNQAIDLNQATNFISSKDFWPNKFDNFLGFFVFNPRPGISRLFTFDEITLFGALGALLSYFFVLALFKLPFFKLKIIFCFLFLVPLLTVLYHGFYIRMGLMWYALGIVPLMTIIAYFFVEKVLKTNKLMIWFTVLVIIENLYTHWTKPRHKTLSRLVKFWVLESRFLIIFCLGLVIVSVYLVKIGKKKNSGS